MVCPFRMQISNAFGGWYLPWECTLAVKELCLFICSLACVASVSVRFRTKKPGTRVKDGAKNGVSKSGERVGKKGRKRLQTNPGILKTAHLACHVWVRAPTFDAVISCHNWPIKCLAFSGAEMNFRGRVCEPKIYFFVFVFFVTRGRRLCWNINESERSIQALDICLFIPSNRTVCKWPSERIQHLYPSKKKKKHQRAGPSMTHCRTPSHSRTKENLFYLFRSRRHFGE